MSFEFRDATLEDVSFILSVRNKDETRKWLHNTSKFTLEEGLSWFKETSPIMYILMKDGVDVGYFRTSDWDSSSVCVGADIHPSYRGRGYAKVFYKLILDYLRDEFNKSLFWLKVFKDNQIALNLYIKLGFNIVSESYNGERPELTMQKVIK